MATVSWIGDSPDVAQVNASTPSSVGVGNVFNVTINAKTISFTATAATVANVTAGLAGLINSSNIPEFTEITAADLTTILTLTAKQAGKPFTQTSSASGGTAAFVTTTTVASSGPNDLGVAANYSTGSLPVNADNLYFEGGAAVLWNLGALSAVTLNSLNRSAAFTNQIGLLDYDQDAGYRQYRPKILVVKASTVNLGYSHSGITSGGPSIERYDFGANATAINVYSTGSPSASDLMALMIKGSGSNYSVNVTSGYVGFAIFNGEICTITTLNNYQGVLSLGSGCTVATMLTDGPGGSVYASCNITTLTNVDGSSTIDGAAAVTTMNIRGGSVNYLSSGTISTAHVEAGATLDFTGDNRAKTVSVLTLSKGSKLIDKAKVVTGLSAELSCGLNDVSIDLGSDITITRS